MLRRLLVVVVAVLVVSSASADVVLRVDFNSNQDGGGDSTTAGDPGLSAAAHNQEGWSSYHANHEVAAEFSTANYGGITVTPAWPNTTANTVQQSIDRANNQNVPPTGNDGNWNNAAGDLNLVTDYIGIDTRTGNGGNGNWDGATGTPTYMTLTLGGLTAGAYEWTSFHHDTENVWGPFAVWLSTDGGGTFTQLADGIMTDSTTGGTPDSGAPVSGPDVYSLASTYRTSFTASGTDDVVLRWAPYSDAAGVHRQIWGMNGFVLELVGHYKAFGPTPTNGAPDVAKSVVLSWSPADDTAATNGHKIFLSDNFADVDGGLAAVERGVLSDPVFDTATLPFALEYSTTYYWRIDQASTPGGPWNPGEVWSFTVEPFVYPIDGSNITATASSSESASTGPENTINGSGLDAGDLHSVEPTDMWLSGGEPQGASIEYKFDKAYKLHQMWVWNHNTTMETTFGLGVEDATIQYSTNGTDYATLGTTHEFKQAPGTAGYEHNTEIDFGGAVARYVKITANSNWGDLATKYGLSEVRFFYIPVRARLPEPASGATNIDVDGVTLRWRAGREAASHEVYLSTDKRAVAEGTVPPLTVAEASHDTGELDLGQTYYWKVNEINQAEDPAVWEGDLWDFATQDFLVVDDFEGYKGDEVPVTEQLWGVWRDGLGYGAVGVPPYYPGNGTGSEIGDATTDSYTEETINHGGFQSMPYVYNNDKAGNFKYSEAKRTLPAGLRDWAEKGIKALSLWFYGDLANAAERMYVAIGNSNGTTGVVSHDNPNATQIDDWTEWNIDLKDFEVQGVDLSDVNSIAIGFGNRDNPQAGGDGKMYFDDIRLYPARCLPGLLKPAADLNNDCVVDYLDIEILANEWLGTGYEITPVNPGSAGLVGHWAFDDGSGTTAQDSSGNNNHGTVMGGAQWVAGGKVGGALAFDGVDDIVEVEQNSGLPIYNNGTDNAYSIAMWVRGRPQNDMRVFAEASTTSNNPLFNMGTHNSANPTGQYAAYIRPDTGTTLNHPLSQAEPFDKTWHHIAWVDENGTARLYVDGELDGGNFNYTRGTMALDTTSIGGIRRAAPSHFFTGQIDDVYVYNRALSQPEIAWLVGHTSPFSEPFDMYQDGTVDFKDFAVLADSWLDEQLWP